MPHGAQLYSHHVPRRTKWCQINAKVGSRTFLKE